MIERVSLRCGDWLWRRVGLPPIADWLARLFEGQPVAPLLISVGDSDPETVCDMLAREVHRAAPGPEFVETVEVTLGDAAPIEGLDCHLMATLLGVGETERSPLISHLARACERAAQIAWIDVPPEHLGQTQDAARRVLTEVRQLSPEACLGFGLRVRGRLSGNPIPLDQLWPAESPHEVTGAKPWVRYVHLRLAWHAGGRADLVFSAVSERLPQNPDDKALSSALDRLSTRWFDQLPQPTQDALTSADPDALPVCMAEHGLQLDCRLGWLGPPIPAPWVARALLVRIPQHPARRQLRAAESCRPWTRALLDRCLWLESLVLDRLVPDDAEPTRTPDPDRDHIYMRFVSGRGAEAQFIVDCRSTNPMEPLDFHSLGEAGYHLQGAMRDFVGQLRRLRNVLAHGHAVGWDAHEALERIEDQAARLT